ncbi:hypothetical protein SALBM135S_10106 [Streptomyces alboniger]
MPEAVEDEADEEMPLSLRLSIADTLTLGNATCGFMAVYFTTTGILIPHLQGSNESGMARHSRRDRRDPDALRGRLRPLRRTWRASCGPRRWAPSWTTSRT